MQTNARTLTISVRDTGIGVSRDGQAKLFRKWTQLGVSGSESSQGPSALASSRLMSLQRPRGSGLGLFVAQSIARWLGTSLSNLNEM